MIKFLVSSLRLSLQLSALGFIVAMASCSNKNAGNDWLRADDVHVAVDATFEPIMSEQLQQFALSHPEAQMKELYCSEDSAIRLLVNDSLRTIIATRKLTEKERMVVKSHHLDASQAFIATDAFALIVSKNNPDTLITLEEVKKIVSGEITRWEQLEKGQKKGEIKMVFDHSGSSTVRYMRDSLCSGKELKGNIFAQGSTKAVFDAVKADPNVIGVVGVDWLRGENESALASFSNLDVSVMFVRRDKESYHRRPYQYYIGTGEYPLTRSVYVITTDPRTRSQEKYLFFWLKGQKGQLIFCNNSQLLPMMQVQIKDVTMK